VQRDRILSDYEGRGKSRGMRKKCRYEKKSWSVQIEKKVWKHDFTPFPLIYLFVRNFTKIHGKSIQKTNSWEVCEKIQRHGEINW
jgi:hypothetical protein